MLADDVHRDLPTGKYTIVGTFDAFGSPVFPRRFHAAAVYLKARGGRGTVPMTLRLVDVDETRPPVFDCVIMMHFPDPTQAVETALKVYGPFFPEPGDYRLQCLAGGEVLGEQRLMVVRKPVEDADC
jgi:hypothetical protein